ncbi:MAG: urate hydroxylase PuuD [Candidatus Parcubacteria bacterium]|nr:urate hydroxylase PuuD [Burkholderiales bacterium]
MEAYLLDWLSLLLRWAHLVVGIAWIGASFYFIWLDGHLQPSGNPDLAGDLWAVHGGGFYHAEKFRGAPPEMPARLHWFKWEAYWTWITGFFLLALVYYAGAELYLIDPSVLPLSKLSAIGIGLGSMLAGLVVYEGLCRSPLGRNDKALAAVMFALLAAAAWGLTQLFSGRGAFIHYGAILGTIMVANVAHVIIPGQRRMVAAMAAGSEPDPKDGAAGKQRSVHNTYFTLPVLFTMISSHYAFTFGARWNWLVLVALTLSGALIRVWFVMRHKGGAPAWPLVTGLGLLVVPGVFLSPKSEQVAAVKFEDVQGVIAARCTGCHSAKPAFQGVTEAPKGVLLDTPERIVTLRAQIHQQTVLSRAMPPGNLTQMTEEERRLLDHWHRAR